MATWLWSIPPHNYARCVESQTFAVRVAGRRAIEQIQPGDRIFAYLPGPKVVGGMFRAERGYYQANDLIWDDGTFPHRIRVSAELLLPEEARVPLDAFKDRLQVGSGYPNFGLVIQKVVHRLSEEDGDVLEQLVRREIAPPQKPPQSPRAESIVQQPQRIASAPQPIQHVQELHRAHQRIGLLQRKVGDLEELLALAGPNLEDYLRLAHSSQGAAFEEATRKCFVALGFALDPDYQGQAGEIDFVAVAPFLVFGECQASGGENVGVTIVDKLLRHRRRYLLTKNLDGRAPDCRVVISEFATAQLTQDAQTEHVAILRPSQLAALVKLKREYPGAVHPYNIRAVLEQPGDITTHVVRFIDLARDEIEKRVGIIEVLKNDRFIRLAEMPGRDPGWIQARLEAELETHMPLHEVDEILRELTSPLVGCVGVQKDPSARLRYYYIRDYDFQVPSIGPRVDTDPPLVNG